MVKPNTIALVVKKFFTLVPATTLGGFDNYVCVFCGQTYAYNVTRMRRHVLSCAKSTPAAKLEIKKVSSDSGGKLASASGGSHSVPSTSALPAHEEYSIFGSSNTRKRKRSSFSTSSRIDLTEELSTDTFSEEMEDFGDLDLTSPIEPDSHNESVAACSGDRTTSTPTPSKRNLGPLNSFVDSMSKSSEAQIWELLARACYCTATPLNFTENEHWIAAFKKIRPSMKLPSRYHLSGPLLDEEFKRIEDDVKNKIGSATSLGLQLDGWTNLRNEPIVNVVVTTPEPVVFKVIDTKDNRHTGDYMSQIMTDVLTQNGINRFTSVVTDNAANMQKSWDLLKEKFPDSQIAYYGCAAHIMNLLVNDIMKLPTFSNIRSSAKEIVKNVKGSHIVNALFIQQQEAEKERNKKTETFSAAVTTLKLPVKTRWASIVHCLESLLKNKHSLQGLAVLREVVQNDKLLSKTVRSHILDDEIFWVRVKLLHELLQPMKKWIDILESDRPRISLVIEAFKDLEKHFKSKLPLAPGSRSEERNVLKFLSNRKSMAVHPIHFAANILDPHLLGKNLTPQEDVDGTSHINDVAEGMGLVSVDVISDLASYKCKQGLWSKAFVWNALKAKSDGTKISSLTWWKGICNSSKLSRVATAILEAPATSAATERSFSTYGLVHTAKRNRLTNERAGKLVFIKHNLKVGTEKTYAREHVFSDWESDTDTEDEGSARAANNEEDSAVEGNP